MFAGHKHASLLDRSINNETIFFARMKKSWKDVSETFFDVTAIHLWKGQMKQITLFTTRHEK
jgi:hypothetical protein